MSTEGARVYNLFPLLAGPVNRWHEHLPRIAEMGFDHVYLNPFHYPGFSGSLYAVKDYYRLHPLLAGDSGDDEDAMLAGFVEAAGAHGIDVVMDLVVNHTAKDSVLVESHPEWFVREPDGSLRSPRAVDPDDPEKVTVWGDLAEIDYSERGARAEIVSYWRDLARHYLELGFRGFRCDAAYQVPAPVWRELVTSARETRPDALFLAETLGCTVEQVEALRPAGFDYLFNSAKWWDFEAHWLLDQYEAFRHIGPSIAFPESHDTERLVVDLEAGGITGAAAIEAGYRLRYAFAATFSTGVMMPMGYEYGFGRRLDVVQTRPEHWEEPRFDLTGFVAETNRLKASLPALNREGPQRRLDTGDLSALALVRGLDGAGGRVLVLVNPDLESAAELAPGTIALPEAGEHAREVTGDGDDGARPVDGCTLEPGAVRVFRLPGAARPPVFPEHPPESEGDLLGDLASRPILVGDVWPCIDGGRFPVKREVGDVLEVWATVFREGHDRIAAAVKHRRKGADEWRETPMRLENAGLDRWRGAFRLDANARHEYTIEAWPDEFGSWRGELEKKREAGQDVSLELVEGRDLVVAAVERASGADARVIALALERFDATHDPDVRAGVFLDEGLRDAIARWPERGAAVRAERVLEVIVDRVRARFAAWYEMFPRSQGTEPGRSATFADCERRLPEVRSMGFDVVYLVPIHPIGRTHRKGPNNTLSAGPDDPGSPYAIGSEEGGHTTVHPDLGTLEDFRRFVRAAHAHGMEVALDFAIQCSPDHPWIREHPQWFRFRPDGTIRYAENPPKKYQDIVNVDFYGSDRDALWRELRDVVLFWVEQGVKIFRVDNPHTKPVPFWEWMIREVQARDPEVVFLSEAFTRPPMLKMLAKVGFSQSYTYFTWRNFKHELTEYLTELSRSECVEYLRPNFFPNTPDILPYFLQTGGRPAFMIRFVLASTLSSVYGIYNGFELCENEALPGKEEYAHSEKFEYKVWDWDRPGNIKDWITRINGIRRDNPALHELDGLEFHHAGDDNVLFYSKMTPSRDNVIFVAVNLDPFEAHESEVVFPLREIGVPHDGAFEVEELLSGEKHLWQGAHQRVHLDPHASPAAIYRVAPWTRVDYREPCF